MLVATLHRHGHVPRTPHYGATTRRLTSWRRREILRCLGLGPERMRRVLRGRDRRSDWGSARTPPDGPLRVRRALRHQRRCRVPGGSSPHTVAPDLAKARAPRLGTTSTGPRALHAPRRDVPRPRDPARRPGSLPATADLPRSARRPLRHTARAVRARREAEPAAHALVRCDRDCRPCQDRLAIERTTPVWSLRPRPRDKGDSGWRRTGGKRNSFGIVPFPSSGP